MNLAVIAHIHTDFPEKFGIPRQSGRVEETVGVIRFEDEFRSREALRGIEGYSHLWLIWGFDRNSHDRWTPTVRPPRLGGNKRMGVFATRSPYRPNPIGLSCVKIERVDYDAPDAPLIYVRGADLADGTPIYDIKPYLPQSDSRPDATNGFSGEFVDYALEVDFPDEWLAKVPEDKRDALFRILADDPRPSYQDDPERVYYMAYADFEVGFRVADGRLNVCEVRER